MSVRTLHLVTGRLGEVQRGALCHGLGADDVVVLVGVEPIASLASQSAAPSRGKNPAAPASWRAYEPSLSGESLPAWLEPIDARQWAMLVEQCGRTMTWSAG